MATRITCSDCRTPIRPEVAAGPKHRAVCAARPTSPRIACQTVRDRTAADLDAALADEATARGMGR